MKRVRDKVVTLDGWLSKKKCTKNESESYLFNFNKLQQLNIDVSRLIIKDCVMINIKYFNNLKRVSKLWNLVINEEFSWLTKSIRNILALFETTLQINKSLPVNPFWDQFQTGFRHLLKNTQIYKQVQEQKELFRDNLAKIEYLFLEELHGYYLLIFGIEINYPVGIHIKVVDLYGVPLIRNFIDMDQVIGEVPANHEDEFKILNKDYLQSGLTIWDSSPDNDGKHETKSNVYLDFGEGISKKLDEVAPILMAEQMASINSAFNKPCIMGLSLFHLPVHSKKPYLTKTIIGATIYKALEICDNIDKLAKLNYYESLEKSVEQFTTFPCVLLLIGEDEDLRDSTIAFSVGDVMSFYNQSNDKMIKLIDLNGIIMYDNIKEEDNNLLVPSQTIPKLENDAIFDISQFITKLSNNENTINLVNSESSDDGDDNNNIDEI